MGKILALSRPRIGLESLLEHFIFLNVIGGGPQGLINIHTIKF